MSVISSNILAGASGQGGVYNLTKSLRFRSSASAYLNRTPSTAGSRTTWTWSGWVKRGKLGDRQVIFGGGSNGTSTDHTYIEFSASDVILFDSYGVSTPSFAVETTAVYRDPSAWYHIVAVLDTTQATSTNRVKLYVNGVQITAFSSPSYPSQNYAGGVNAVAPQTFASYPADYGPFYFDGYLAEVNFIDGQALTPSSFGQTSTSTGVWIPKKYTGSYGTNGFYLPFTDTTSTSTLGTDFSGNSNTWTVNNISLTAGSTYDSMNDVPTLTSATVANYAVMNPLNKAYSTYTLSDGNLNWTSSTVNMGAHGTFQLPTSGKYYWEVVMTANAGGSPAIGIADGLDSLGNKGIEYRTSGNKEQNGGVSGNGSGAYGATWTTNDVIGVAYDADTSSGQITFYKNGSSQGVAYSSIQTNFPNGLFPAFQNNASGTTTFITNFGQRPFSYTPPTGFVALNTFNLPTPTIGYSAAELANKYMDVSLYTGNGTSQSIINSGSMQPDLTWIKVRDTTSYHELTDSVRGTGKTLFSNATDAELTTNTMTAFNSNGFSVAVNGGYFGTNENGRAFVGWQWRASNATAVTNTAGSITSTVSASTTAGFSIVTYTGNGTNSTVGHGLGVAPKMIIVKARNVGTQDWQVYHETLGINQAIQLNLTSAVSPATNYWYNGVTSTVFGVNGSYAGINANTNTYVAYCFAQVAGYSAFGSYTGNGSTDGTFVYLGFRPRFLLTKNSSSGSSYWRIWDTSRSPYNEVINTLFPNVSNAEDVGGSGPVDILSNGFKIRTSATNDNGSGNTIIYMAFAEVPQKFALGR